MLSHRGSIPMTMRVQVGMMASSSIEREFTPMTLRKSREESR